MQAKRQHSPHYFSRSPLKKFNLFLIVLKKTGALHRDKTETLRLWRAPLFPAMREKKATRYAGGSLLKDP